MKQARHSRTHETNVDCRSPADEDSRRSTDESKTERRAMAAIEEARIVLPGIQALFGFQLIAAGAPLPAA
jgi:hypothetical protein